MRDFLAAMMRGFQAATPPGLDTVSDEVKSALKEAKADAENQMRGFQAATTPEADTVSDELKSALKKAKADAENQKRQGSDKAKSIEKSIEEKLRSERPRAQERAEQERLEAEAQRKLAASKRVEWLGVGMLRAGFKEEQVIRTLTQGGTVVAWGDNDDGRCGFDFLGGNVLAEENAPRRWMDRSQLSALGWRGDVLAHPSLHPVFRPYPQEHRRLCRQENGRC